jgi:hypothetical protein
LKINGIEPFLDKFSLVDGEDWKVGFLRGLANSSCFVALISSKGLGPCRDRHNDHSSDNLLLEYQMALKISQNKSNYINPVLVGEYPEPNLLRKYEFITDVYSDQVEAEIGQRKIQEYLYTVQILQQQQEYTTNKLHKMHKKLVAQCATVL